MPPLPGHLTKPESPTAPPLVHQRYSCCAPPMLPSFSCSSCAVQGGVPARSGPRMDFGELDGIMQTVLSPTSEPTGTGETSLSLTKPKVVESLPQLHGKLVVTHPPGTAASASLGYIVDRARSLPRPDCIACGKLLCRPRMSSMDRIFEGGWIALGRIPRGYSLTTLCFIDGSSACLFFVPVLPHPRKKSKT